jgi:DNA polymerase-3 subunit delta'
MVWWRRGYPLSRGQMYAIFPIPASGKKAGGGADGTIDGMPWDLTGHEGAVDLLRRDIAAGRLAHAYLFAGADGIGKRTLALQFARAIDCQAPPAPGEPCGACRACRLIGSGKHPDLFLLRPDGTGGRILVDAARDLVHWVTLKPSEVERRIALLADFHRALPNAANALLKTIEEPPPSAVLLLTADSADELLPTIVSRCRVVALRPMRESDVAQALIERWKVAPERAELLARLSGGRLGWAIDQARWEDASADRKALFDHWIGVLRGNRAARFDAARRISEDREQTRNTLQSWESLGHDLLIRTLSRHADIANIDFQSQIDSLAGRITPGQARLWLAALRRVEEQLDRNANARLALEAAFLDAPKG